MANNVCENPVQMEDNIKLDLKGTACEEDSIHVDQDSNQWRVPEHNTETTATMFLLSYTGYIVLKCISSP
jgi:hypothetical protein